MYLLTKHYMKNQGNFYSVIKTKVTRWEWNS